VVLHIGSVRIRSTHTRVVRMYSSQHFWVEVLSSSMFHFRFLMGTSLPLVPNAENIGRTVGLALISSTEAEV